jgi:pyrroline-5-carboxylate reductase
MGFLSFFKWRGSKMVKKVSFIGAGSMAEAIIAGMINTGYLKNKQIFVANKENDARLEELTNKYGIVCSKDKQEVIKGAEIVIFATKPYDLENAIVDAREYMTEDQLVISVIAGVSTDFITSSIGKDVAVIRSMPNTSATIGYSATAIAKGAFATDKDIILAETLFQAIGTVSVVEEDQMHVVTGISGSGPAYVYYLVEAMEKAAEAEGLDVATAKQLIAQTVIGAGNMLKNRTESAGVLRENVTSPNGTTAAGLQALADYRFLDAVEACVKSATNRSRELGKE